MMRLPPRIIRRLVLAPLVVILAAVTVWTIPLQILVMVILALIPKVSRITRIITLLNFYLVLEGLALVVLFGSWVASGFGWKIHSPGFRRFHYGLIGWVLRALFRYGCWCMRLRIHYTGENIRDLAQDTPLVLASRHAGPGDSFILINAMINDFRRHPRIVIKDSLQWDPTIDAVMNRLPMVFVTPRSFTSDKRSQRMGRPAERIAGITKDMGDKDALVIFPEGGNFTPERRLRRIEQLREEEHHELADSAERMQHVLAPRPGGLFAAVDAQPRAGVVLVGHVGLEELVSFRSIWQALPMDKALIMKAWYIAPEEIAQGQAPRAEQLFGWWERIDRWIEETEVDPSLFRP